MYYLTSSTFEQYKLAKKNGESRITISLDLGISKTLVLISTLDRIFEMIKKIKENEIFIYDGTKVFKPIFSESSIYSLALDENSYPCLYIDGVKMNVGKDGGVRKYNQDVIRNLKIDDKDNVLEICTGLGYKTIDIASVAMKITTIEKSPDVLKLAKLNPYSSSLFKRKNITLINGDATSKIKELPDKLFSKISHDPPTFKFAPELYSDEFYLDLYRVAKDRAILFHYTGSPGSKFRGKNLVTTTKDKLNSCGWRVFKEADMGLYAIKD